MDDISKEKEKEKEKTKESKKTPKKEDIKDNLKEKEEIILYKDNLNLYAKSISGTTVGTSSYDGNNENYIKRNSFNEFNGLKPNYILKKNNNNIEEKEKKLQKKRI